MFRIILKASASKELAALPRSVQVRFAEAMPALEQDPFQPRSGLDVRPLAGGRGWRLRIGHYRGIYVVEGEAVRFLAFGHRSTAYR